MTIGQRIKNRRIELNMSQEDLARKMGYSTRNAIYQFEQKDNMKLSLVEKFARALDVSPAYLMGWEDISTEIEQQTKPLTDFFKTHEIDYNRVIEALVERYGEDNVKRALEFVRAFLAANPEQQKIALDILKLHQDEP